MNSEGSSQPCCGLNGVDYTDVLMSERQSGAREGTSPDRVPGLIKLWLQTSGFGDEF